MNDALAPRAPAASALPSLLMPALILACLLALAPVLTTRLPALDDYLNHLAGDEIVALGGRDPLLGRYYEIRWAFIPNLAMDLIVPPLGRVWDIFIAGKLLIVAYTLLLLTGPHAIHFALYRRFSLGPLAAVLFIYSGVSKFGLINYEVGVGVALWAVAGWIALRGARPWVRALASAACIVVLFFCHLGALLVYGIAIAGFELWALWSQPKPTRRRLLDFAVLALPALVVVPLMLAGPAMSASSPGDLGALSPIHWGGISARRDGLRAMLEAYAWRYDLATAIAMVAGIVLALQCRMVRLHPCGWAFLLLSGMAFLAIPNEAMGGWGAVIRLPAALVFVVIGLLDWNLASAQRRAAFLVVLSTLAVFRIATVETAWRQFDRTAADLEASLPLIDRGSRVLVAREWANAVSSLSAIQSLPCLAMIERSSLVSLAFSHPLQQILAVRSPYRASAGGYDDDPIPLELVLSPPQPSGPLFFDPTGRIYWADWTRTYDYLYVLDRHGAANPAPDRLDLLYEGERFQLFRVKHT